ncbi:hypothetical protein B0T17DRAFT_2415 [Bombardia bombarda]|uniref:Uncharacterized protein n=1 Tax=Bombardia bombarda TaxID=252184 RepID=A0AA40CDM1_9PEZI|nr:hypothetical protein B0T17DRAFT_2415 [Bombardia bombarda]
MHPLHCLFLKVPDTWPAFSEFIGRPSIGFDKCPDIPIRVVESSTSFHPSIHPSIQFASTGYLVQQTQRPVVQKHTRCSTKISRGILHRIDIAVVVNRLVPPISSSSPLSSSTRAATHRCRHQHIPKAPLFQKRQLASSSSGRRCSASRREQKGEGATKRCWDLGEREGRSEGTSLVPQRAARWTSTARRARCNHCAVTQ